MLPISHHEEPLPDSDYSWACWGPCYSNNSNPCSNYSQARWGPYYLQQRPIWVRTMQRCLCHWEQLDATEEESGCAWTHQVHTEDQGTYFGWYESVSLDSTEVWNHILEYLILFHFTLLFLSLPFPSLPLQRGKAGRMQGNMAGLLAVIKGTPTTYNKDLQVSDSNTKH